MRELRVHVSDNVVANAQDNIAAHDRLEAAIVELRNKYDALIVDHTTLRGQHDALQAPLNQLQEFIGKKKEEDKEKKVVEVEEGPMMPTAADILMFLEAQAKLSGKAALQIFYGCSKCRHSRGGCIYYKCNPTKFEAHRKKFPWKYEGKEIKVDKWNTVSEKELEGEF